MGELYRKEVSLKQITKIIYYTPVLLRLKKYKKLGKMIYMSYKNSIIVCSYRYKGEILAKRQIEGN